jgi:hypothetical protein
MDVMRAVLLHLFAVTMLLAASGCSDDSKGAADGATRDGTGADAAMPDQAVADSALVADLRQDSGQVSTDSRVADGAAKDGALPFVEGGASACDPTCQAQSLELCVRDQDGTCQACLTDGDCTHNPNAFGPRCGTFSGKQRCYCESNLDCAMNPNSLVCYGVFKVCACQGNEDCPVGKTCSGELGGLSVCR